MAQQWKESPEVRRLFDDAGVEGTFLIFDQEAEQFIGYNQRLAEVRQVPASTFKIPHTLIGLATGAVASVDEVLPYGGRPQPFPTWEHDMPLAEAITLSAVPIYQQLAMRIGPVRMREQLERLEYGTREIGSDVTRFWLDGPLRISPIEQVQFLARLASKKLTYPIEMQEAVARIIQIEKTPTYALHAKTGWAFLGEEEFGWWVGWVHRRERLVPFALHMRMRSAEDGPLRIALSKQCLHALAVIE
jgi:beta-lactamase class D